MAFHTTMSRTNVFTTRKLYNRLFKPIACTMFTLRLYICTAYARSWNDNSGGKLDLSFMRKLSEITKVISNSECHTYCNLSQTLKWKQMMSNLNIECILVCLYYDHTMTSIMNVIMIIVCI